MPHPGRALPALLVLAWAAPLAAQEPVPAPTARAVLAQVLERARASGALQRVLGTTRLLAPGETGLTGVLTLETALVGPAAAPERVSLALEVALRRGDGDPVRSSVRYEVGMDGRLLRYEWRRGGESWSGEAEADGTLLLRAAGSDAAPQRLTLGPDVLPPGLAVLLARLHDQGTPAVLDFHLLHGADVLRPVTRLQVEPDAQPGRMFVSCMDLTAEGSRGIVRFTASITAGEHGGQVLGGEFDVFSPQAPRFVAATEAEVQKANQALEQAPR